MEHSQSDSALLGGGWPSAPKYPWHQDMKGHVRGRLSALVADRVGPSLEKKLLVEKEKKIAAMKLVEKEQRETIKAAAERGIFKQQQQSPLQALKSAPQLPTAEKLAARLEDRKRDMAEREQTWHEKRGEIYHKMRTREPLFKTADVSKAQQELKEAARKRRIELENAEKAAWKEIEDAVSRGLQKRETLYNLNAGPSHEVMIAKNVAKRMEAMKEEDKNRKDAIRDAIERGQKKSTTSPEMIAFRNAVVDNTEKQEEILKTKNKEMLDAAKEYFKKREEMLDRQNKREPLFPVGAASTAQKELDQKAKKLKKELADEQAKRRQHIDKLMENALDRPMLMERTNH
eukprot:TRINITY_DN74264_c0_g1_i1.p1 TRINITY_DN74264_c0_g1~~TRINITY_DN74264_c0_g1_i1.p1  ORF type:complete len:369 (+),score=111.01 TRINITY_DN74264_c0_g1_i1:75-1109(+)